MRRAILVWAGAVALIGSGGGPQTLAGESGRGVIVVNWDGTGDYTTIQAAIDNAKPGGVIEVRPSVDAPAGAYVENLSIPPMDLTIRSEVPTDPFSVAGTVIDGGAAGSVVSFQAEATSKTVLDGLTIRNGLAFAGGGILIVNGDPTIRNCVVGGNTADEGGGIRIWNGSPIIEDCAIYQNTAVDSGGGIQCMGFGSGGEHVQITDTVITDNMVTGDWSYGGGLHCDGIDVTITGGQVALNTIGSPGSSGSSGGGINSVKCALDITDCTIQANTTTGDQTYGGGIYALDGSVSLTDCIVKNNNVNAVDFWGGGGVSCSFDVTLTIDGGEITGNSATGSYASYYDGGGGVRAYGGTMTVHDCLIAGNQANGGGGGLLGDTTTMELYRCNITANSADGGGGVMNIGADLDARSCSLTWNTAGLDGGGVYLDGSDADLVNCTIAMNASSDLLGAGGGVAAFSSVVSLINTILWGDTGVFGAELMVDRWSETDPSQMDVAYSDVAGGEAGVYVGIGSVLNWLDGNEEVGPGFMDPDGADGDGTTWEDNDFHLAVESDCIDAGEPGFEPDSGELDIDGEARVQNCRVDMGADESVSEDPPSGDYDDDGEVTLADYAEFQVCFGSTVANPDAPDPCFCAFDFDVSDEIDLDDFTAFHAELVGP